MQLEVKKGIKITIHNKDYGRGCYYSEDDWDIESVATTYEKAIERIIPEYVKSGIYSAYFYISNVKYVTYNGKQCVVYDTDKTPLIYKDKNVIADIKEHPLFEKLSEEKYQKSEAKRKERLREQQIENENKERKLLEELKKKYDN